MKTSTMLAKFCSGPIVGNASLPSGCPAHDLKLWNAFLELSKKRPEHDVPILSSTEYAIPADTNICDHTTGCDVVPVIRSGWAMSAVVLPDGRRQILSFLLPGEIASTALVFGPAAGRVVQSITKVSYCAFNRSELKAALSKHPELFEKFSNVWIAERDEADQLAIDLGRRNADERIARLLLKLTKKLTKRDMARGQTFDFPLRQHQIADATGLTPVHVSRVLSRFRRNGLIGLDGRLLTILNARELERIANPK
jgi:CRP/FNR family transcriptional regulator, anaerobic regulatory protein